MDWRRVGVKRESGKQGLISITSSLFFYKGDSCALFHYRLGASRVEGWATRQLNPSMLGMGPDCKQKCEGLDIN